MATLSELADNVRELCGSPDTTEMPDATIQNMLSKYTLRWINKRRPKLTITSFDTVADQQDYDVVPTASYMVRDVYWLANDYEFFSDSLRNYYVQALEDIDVRLAGYRTIDNPALVEIMLKALQEYNVNFRGEGWETPERKIRLIPVPETAGDAVFFDYYQPRWSSVVATDLLQEYQDAVEHYAAHRVMQALAAKRSVVVSARGYSGDGGRMVKTLADEFLAEAKGLCPEAGAFFARM